MALIINETDIPASGSICIGDDIEKVVCNGTTVWEKITEVEVPVESVYNYMMFTRQETRNGIAEATYEITPADGMGPLPIVDDQLYFGVGLWSKHSGSHTLCETYKITPKAPYTKISASFEGKVYIVLDLGSVTITVNDTTLYKIHDTSTGTTVDVNHPLTLNKVPSITIVVETSVYGFEDHWHTRAVAAMKDFSVA